MLPTFLILLIALISKLSKKSYSFVKPLGAVIICILCYGCSSKSLLPSASSIQNLDRSTLVPDVPYFPQVENQCGPAALATLLVHRGLDVTPEELREKLFIPEKGGSLAIELMARSRQYGLLAYTLQHNAADLLTELEDGNPVLVLQNLGFNWLPQWHFAVAIGYDLNSNRIQLRSGENENYKVDFELFLKTWQRANYWAMIVLPPNRIPRTAVSRKYIQAASDLEQVGKIKEAKIAFSAAQSKWHDNPTAILGLGNTSYALKEYVEAKNYFYHYCKIKPESPIGWNNLAYSLEKLGCNNEAKLSVECATKLDPHNSEFNSSLKEIKAMVEANKNISLPVINCGVISCPDN